MKLRILIIAHSFEWAGAQRSLAEIARELKRNGERCLVVGPREGPMAQAYRDWGFDVIQIRLGTLFCSRKLGSRLKQIALSLFNAMQLSLTIARFRPHLAYTNTSSVISGLVASILTGTPHAWNIRENFDTFTFDYCINKPILAWLARKFSSTTIFVSALSRRSLFPDPPQHALVAHNGIDCSRFLQASLSNRKLKSIGCISSISPRRGLDTLINASKELLEQGVRFSLDIWGKGNPAYERDIRNLISENGLDRHVRLKGYSDDVTKLFAEYDLIVVPSRGESFCRPALEAMASGVPIVTTRCGGPEEFVNDHVNGRTVPPCDPTALAEAIRWIFDDFPRASALAQNAFETAQENFRIEDKLQHIQSIIRYSAPIPHII